jgi:hypothetical protein
MIAFWILVRYDKKTEFDEGCKYLFGDSIKEINKTYDLLPSIFGEIYR